MPGRRHRVAAGPGGRFDLCGPPVGYKLNAEMADLTFETVASGDTYVIHCKGRLVSDHAFLLRNHLKPLIPNARRITLDMTEVTYVDSMGLGTVASLYVSARTAGCQFEVINLSRRVRELFSVARLLPLLEVAGRSSLIP